MKHTKATPMTKKAAKRIKKVATNSGGDVNKTAFADRAEKAANKNHTEKG